MRPNIFLATIGRGSNGSNALEVTEDRAAVTAESQDNIINRVNNVSQYGPSWHYVPGIGVAGTAYAEVPGSALGDLAFSRASSKTRTNAAGVVETIGNNVPPHDYRNADGSLSTFPRLNLEPQRTNLVLWSEQIDNGAWNKLGVTVLANNTTSPDGTVDAERITGDGISSLHVVQTNSISFTGTTYSFSVYAKKNTNDFIQLIIPANGGGMFANFNINTGVVGTLGTVTGTAPTSSITSAGNGWYRCTINFTATGINTNAFTVAIVTSASAARAENNTLTTSVFLWGAQLEAGAYPTTYIPTTTAAVTRIADLAIKTGVSSLIGQTEGTVFLDLNYQAITGISMFLSIRPNSANKIEVYRDGTSIYGDVLGNSGSVVLIRVANPAGQYKIALAYKSGQTALYINGTSVGTSATAFSFTTSMADLFLNLRSGPTFVEQTFYNQSALFPTRLTNAQLAQLTTL